MGATFQVPLIQVTGSRNVFLHGQSIARRDKKAFLREQCKEIEGNNRTGKTRDLFKKIRQQGNISSKDGHNRQKWYGHTRAEEIKKRWKEYKEELYKKGLNNLDSHNNLVVHLPDVLECEVKWALGGSITTNTVSRGDGIRAELFQIPKDDAAKVMHSISQQIWKTQQWPQDWIRSVFSSIPKKSNTKQY